MKRPLRILVAHNVFGKRTGGMSRLMGFVHDQLVLAGHSVDYFCTEDFPRALGGRFARFTFLVLLLRHAMAAARAGRPFDLINVLFTTASRAGTVKSTLLGASSSLGKSFCEIDVLN